MPPAETLAQLAALSEKLGSPGIDKLHIAARRQGLAVSRHDVRELVRRQGERQLFAPVRPSAGKSAAEGPDSRFQADLIDLKNDPSQAHKNILVLVNVFSRELYARACKSKDPAVVAAALKAILDELPARPQFISTDAGEEFKGPVDTLLQHRDIVHRTRPVGDVNALSVVDRAIQNLKQRLARSLAKAGGGEWREKLKDAVEAYNETYHSAVHDAPGDVRGSPVVTFMNMQDNAEKLDHNQRLLERRTRVLEEAGAFRRPVPGALTKFKRSFHATYGEAQAVKAIKGSEVEGADGQKVDIKRVLPVDRDSSTVTAHFALGSARLDRKREKLLGIVAALYEWLGGAGQKSMTTAAVYLRKHIDDYDQILRDTNLRLADVVRLFEGTLELTMQGYYVRRAE